MESELRSQFRKMWRGVERLLGFMVIYVLITVHERSITSSIDNDVVLIDDVRFVDVVRSC